MRIRLLILLMLAFLLALGACGDDDDDSDATDDDGGDDDSGDDDTSGDDDDDDDDTPWPPNDAVEEGKRWLALGDGDRANEFFRMALEQVPDHPEANYGVVLGHDLHMLDVVGILWDYIESLAQGGPIKKSDDPDNMLDNFLDEALAGLFYTDAREQFEFIAACLENGYEFEQTDPIPIIMHFEQWAEMAGEFDDAELHGSYVATQVLWGLFGQLDTISLNSDLTILFAISEIDFDDLLPALGEIVDLLLALLTDPTYPDFMTLPEENIPQLQEAALMLAGGMDQFLLMFDAIDMEIGDQSNDVVGYADGNDNFQFDEWEYYRFPGLGTLDMEGMKLAASLQKTAIALRNSLFDDTEYDVNPAVRQPFNLSYLNPLLKILGLPPVIPHWCIFDVDLGAMYADPGTDGLKTTLVQILEIADFILEIIGDEV